MILGRVVGEVWTTKKHQRLQGLKLLLVRPQAWYNPIHETDLLVAIDPLLEAGIGDMVIVCLGAPPRWQAGSRTIPVEAAVMGIVDRLDVTDEVILPPDFGHTPLNQIKERSDD